jgi:UDP-N-acetyl-D-glucosamine/UDP-N-acetyl-D-galactosamine dehydrogenase
MINLVNAKLAIVGLGYVGLPLAVEFGKLYETIGFDINESRINDLINGYDATFEVESDELSKKTKLKFTSNIDLIKNCNIFIVTVPTPIDDKKNPDLTPLINASSSIGRILKKDDIVIFESTVFPGATEEICVPILEKYSKLNFNTDFFCGYSPERINPGDKGHRIRDIKKVTSGSNIASADFVDSLYASIIDAGTHKASSIKIAEAAKVIENTQRDVNIALINELAIIFNRLDIDTESVLEAAGTKWNFLPFKPGLVGGHCIGVDPYYLTHKSIEVGYHPNIILAGRSINDGMASHIVSEVSKLMTRKGIKISGSNILIMGLTFKENCPDLRNTRVVDLVNGFTDLNCSVDVYDPIVNPKEAKINYNILPLERPEPGSYDAIIIAVAHNEFKDLLSSDIHSFGKRTHILYDIKYLYKADETDGRL